METNNQQVQDKKKKKWPFVVGGIAVAIVILCAVGNMGGNKDNKSAPANVSGGQTTTQPTTEKTDVVKLGNSVSTNTIKITFSECDVNSKDYNKYSTVKTGYKIVKAKFSFENISKEDAIIGSFACYADGESCEKFFTGNNFKDPCLESVSSGRKASGVLFFEVPENAKSIEIKYTDNMWTSSHIIFKAK